MEWFENWWSGLKLLEQVMYCIAIPSSLLLFIQTILLAIGAAGAGSGDMFNPSDTSGLDMYGDTGDIGGDFDTDFDTDFDAGDAGAQPEGSFISDGSAHGRSRGAGSQTREFGIANLFTLQGITAFLCVFGWMGALMASGGVFAPLALGAAFLLGFIVMYGIAKFVQYSAKLAYNGTLNMNSLLGENGTVYIKIPPKGAGQGKVMVQTTDRFVEFEAVSEGEAEIPSNTPIRVVDILGGNVLVVESVTGSD